MAAMGGFGAVEPRFASPQTAPVIGRSSLDGRSGLEQGNPIAR